MLSKAEKSSYKFNLAVFEQIINFVTLVQELNSKKEN